MRGLLFAFVIACSSSSKPAQPPPSEPSGEPILRSANPLYVSLEDLVSATAVGLGQFPPKFFMPLGTVRDLLDKTAPCFEALERGLVAGYHVQHSAQAADTYFILEGKLPRAEVIRCIPIAIQRAKILVKDEGDLVSFAFDEKPDHRAYAVWRDPFVVVGTKLQVQSALTTATEATRAKWSAVAQKSGLVWMARSDHLMTRLFGVETKHYVLVVDDVTQGGFSARVIATYGNTGDAAVAARRIKEGEIQPDIDAPANVKTAFKRMVVKQAGATVELGFNLETFGGLSLDELQAWAMQLAN